MEEEEALNIINGYAADSYESFEEIEQKVKDSYSQRLDNLRYNTRQASYSFVAGAGAYYIENTYSGDNTEFVSSVSELAGILLVTYGVITTFRAGYHATKAYSLHQQKQEIEEKGLDQILEEEDSLEFVQDTLSD